MKLLFTLLLSLILLTVRAQGLPNGYAGLPKDSATQKVAYSGVVQVAASKAELFSRAQEWAARSFLDSKNASRIADKDAGTVLYRGSISTTKPGAIIDNGTTLGFTLAIYVKDGRYKYLIDEFTDKPHLPENSLLTPVERWEKYAGRSWAINRANELNDKVKYMVESLREAMEKPAPKGW
jgi:hypothetical protein